jgi:hypothetical protein
MLHRWGNIYLEQLLQIVEIDPKLGYSGGILILDCFMAPTDQGKWPTRDIIQGTRFHATISTHRMVKYCSLLEPSTAIENPFVTQSLSSSEKYLIFDEKFIVNGAAPPRYGRRSCRPTSDDESERQPGHQSKQTHAPARRRSPWLLLHPHQQPQQGS